MNKLSQVTLAFHCVHGYIGFQRLLTQIFSDIQAPICSLPGLTSILICSQELNSICKSPWADLVATLAGKDGSCGSGYTRASFHNL